MNTHFKSLPPIFFNCLKKIFQQDLLLPLKVLSQSPRSVVVSCFHKSLLREVILKIVTSHYYWKREVSCLSSLNHPNIVKLIDYFQCDGVWCLVQEKVVGTCLIDYLCSEKKLSESEASSITRQLIDALIYLHSKGWAHRDLKPDNLIYDKYSGLVKIIDFEFSCKISKWKKHHTSIGTLLYCSPEVRKGKYKGPEAEVWSLGVTVFVMVKGCFPFTEEHLLSNEEEYVRTEGISDDCAHFLNITLQKDPKRREKLESLRNHEWIRLSRSCSSPF